MMKIVSTLKIFFRQVRTVIIPSGVLTQDYFFYLHTLTCKTHYSIFNSKIIFYCVNATRFLYPFFQRHISRLFTVYDNYE